jgi:hypothetical protein
LFELPIVGSNLGHREPTYVAKPTYALPARRGERL